MTDHIDDQIEQYTEFDLYQAEKDAELGLLEKIHSRLSDGLQTDLEHGVKVLSDHAAMQLKRDYPELVSAIEWINDLYYEALSD